MKAIFDIEANGLYYEVKEIHCISIKLDGGDTKVYTSRDIVGSAGTLQQGLDVLSEADVIIGHNIINYDIPAIEKIFPKWTYKSCLDTLLMSRLAYPNMFMADANRKSIPPKFKGGHGLKAWGYRLRKLKGEYEEQWAILTPEMVEYCRQDSEVTYALFEKLESRKIPDEAIRLEHEFAQIINRQEKYGVWFDIEKAQKLHVELLQEIDEAETELLKVFTPLKTWMPKIYPKIATKKDGQKSQVLINQENLGYHFNEAGEWGCYVDIHYNPSSRQHNARWLKEVYNWEPTEFTEHNTPVVNEKVLEQLDFKEGKILAHYFNVKKLIGQLAEGKNAWMKMVKEDHRIHGSVNTLGAVSRRCTHSNPNLAQVPSERAYKGHESRALFSTPKGKALVGCDADGLELRTLSHYMAKFDDGIYSRAVDGGSKENGTDIHSVNQKNAGLPSRDMAKTLIYAVLYGAGDEKVGNIVNGSEVEGRKLKERFFKSTPAIKTLIDQIASVYKKTKTIKALDGTPYHIRSSHSALNTLLQGAGALVMKYYLIFLDRNLKAKYKSGEQYEFVLNVHDEVQIECDEDIAKDVATIAETSFDDVTNHLKFRIPIRGTAAIGKSWAETH